MFPSRRAAQRFSPRPATIASWAAGTRSTGGRSGHEGGPKSGENALGVDFPTGMMSGAWISPNMHNIILVNGRPHHVIVMPDKDSKVVNVGGNHSIRGGVLAKKLFNPNEPSQGRLRQPMMRVRGTLQEVSWDTALGVMAGLSKHVLEKYGEHAWAMKTYSYQYFENTYAISKTRFPRDWNAGLRPRMTSRVLARTRPGSIFPGSILSAPPMMTGERPR